MDPEIKHSIGFSDERFEEFKKEDWTPDTMNDEIERHWEQKWDDLQADDSIIKHIRDQLKDSGKLEEEPGKPE
ncbi:hypothetical protein ADUPG1_000165 [Aduncisulcus paluster]|uniref:Uncharacterized protein n=1 Tax=Aduncisulcus paluster TaxID=2918883 RepID=A0ABQ5K8V1_9EUKA|nr:hypothetical protein ADUPG1_000165 [Aduncisulcus paluster]